MSLEQSDIDRLAGQIDRLAMLVNGVGKRVAEQETLLDTIQQQMNTQLAPVVNKLNEAFQSAETASQEVMEVVSKADAVVAELAGTVQDALSNVLENPPVTQSLAAFDQAIETAGAVNEALHGRLANLNEIVEGAEADVSAVLDAISDKSVELTDELLTILTEEAAALTAKMAEAVFGPIQEALEAMTDALQEVAGEKISAVLETQIERLGEEVTEQLDKVLAFLKTSTEEMIDKIADQLETDTENEQSARAVLEDAVAPLEPVMDQVREAYNVFKSIADSVGVSLPELG